MAQRRPVSADSPSGASAIRVGGSVAASSSISGTVVSARRCQFCAASTARAAPTSQGAPRRISWRSAVGCVPIVQSGNPDPTPRSVARTGGVEVSELAGSFYAVELTTQDALSEVLRGNDCEALRWADEAAALGESTTMTPQADMRAQLAMRGGRYTDAAMLWSGSSSAAVRTPAGRRPSISCWIGVGRAVATGTGAVPPRSALSGPCEAHGSIRVLGSSWSAGRPRCHARWKADSNGATNLVPAGASLRLPPQRTE
jgi:hypothetical protein